MHSCGGQPCQGSDTNLDDDEVSMIGPGSTIMYLVYGIENAEGTSNCLSEEQHRAIFDVATSCIQDETYRTAGEHCEYEWWAAGIDSLIPNRYAFSSAASDTSTDGATNFAARFGDDWDQYIYHACVTGNTAEAQARCEHSNTAGNCIFDGGLDMYDIGNVITTSLMGMPTGGAVGCDLGSIRYEREYAPIQTSCFGPGGYYQMNEMEGLCAFRSMALDFTIQPCVSLTDDCAALQGSSSAPTSRPTTR